MYPSSFHRHLTSLLLKHLRVHLQKYLLGFNKQHSNLKKKKNVWYHDWQKGDQFDWSQAWPRRWTGDSRVTLSRSSRQRRTRTRDLAFHVRCHAGCRAQLNSRFKGFCKVFDLTECFSILLKPHISTGQRVHKTKREKWSLGNTNQNNRMAGYS